MADKKLHPKSIHNLEKSQSTYSLGISKSSFFYVEEEEEKPRFSDTPIRSKFVAKVYTILTVQLVFTILCTVPFVVMEEAKKLIDEYSWLIFVFSVMFVVPYLMLICCESTRKGFPTNVILLILLTLGMAGVCAYCTAWFKTEVVLYTFLLTLVVTISITILAVMSPFDFTSCQMVMCVLVVFLVVFAIIALAMAVVAHSPVMNLVYCGIIVILFTLFLIHDTQAIMGGRRISLAPNEYVVGAAQIYVDIVQLFLHFLELVGACTEND